MQNNLANQYCADRTHSMCILMNSYKQAEADAVLEHNMERDRLAKKTPAPYAIQTVLVACWLKAGMSGAWRSKDW